MQVGADLFNKGRLLNAASQFALKLGVRCLIVHDVDMMPLVADVPYSCPPVGSAMHLGAYVDSLNFQ